MSKFNEYLEAIKMSSSVKDRLSKKMTRKPENIHDIKKINFRDLHDDEHSFINTLEEFDVDELFNKNSDPFNNEFKIDVPQWFIMNWTQTSFLINTEGYNYIRYIVAIDEED